MVTSRKKPHVLEEELFLSETTQHIQDFVPMLSYQIFLTPNAVTVLTNQVFQNVSQ